MHRRVLGLRRFCKDAEASRVLAQGGSSARAVARMAWASARLLKQYPALSEAAFSQAVALKGPQFLLVTSHF